MPLILSQRFYTDWSTFSLNLPGIQTLQEPQQLITSMEVILNWGYDHHFHHFTKNSDGVPDACSSRQELTYFTGKTSKNRLVYKRRDKGLVSWELHAPSHIGYRWFIIHTNSSFVVISSKITIKDSACKTYVCMFWGEKQFKLTRESTKKKWLWQRRWLWRMGPRLSR